MEELWKLKSNGYPCHMPLCIMKWLISSFFRLTQRCILICNEEVHIYSIPFDSGTPQLGTRDRNSKTLNLTLRFADTTEFELRHWTDLESWGSGTIQRARGAVAGYSDPARGERRRCSGLTTEENVLGFPQMPTGRRPWSRRWGGGGERSLGPALACLLPTPYMRTTARRDERDGGWLLRRAGQGGRLRLSSSAREIPFPITDGMVGRGDEDLATAAFA
jgi:hypothetical protein